MKSNRIALAAALVLAIAAPALAASSTTALTAAGSTIAGPGTTSLAGNATQTVYTDAAANADACVTVVNAGGSSVRLSVTDDIPSTPSIDVAVGGSGALCRDATTKVDLTCLGATACSAQWRVDRY